MNRNSPSERVDGVPAAADRHPLWYFHRLRKMSPREWLHRSREQIRLYRLPALGNTLRRISYEPDRFSFCREPVEQLPELEWRPLRDPEALVRGEWPALGFPWSWRNTPDCWRRAPDTLRMWPDAFFGRIRYRSPNHIGDVRVAWEPARLQQLVSLARLAGQTASQERHRACMALFSTQLESWYRQNPPYQGIHYISSMECALRVLSLCYAFDLMRPGFEPSTSLWRILLAVVDSHARLIERRLSLYSSTGNHTIAEAAGLVYAGELFPEFDAADQWRATGLRLLTREADRQILPDGGGLEQAFWYHLLVVDLCGLVNRLLLFRGREAPESLTRALLRGRRFLNRIATCPEELPDVGDRDGGYALSPELAISWNHPRDEGERGLALEHFESSGYSLLRDRPCAKPRWKILFDHGPLGMPPGQGHGHADALSVLVWRDGQPLLVDSGTFTYCGTPGGPDWRAYFRGTSAHNTLTLEGLDQARQQGDFLWSQNINVSLIGCEKSADRLALLARHQGYSALGVTHWRGLLLNCQGEILIWDWLTGRGSRNATLHWHFAVSPEGEDGHWMIPMAAGNVRLLVQGGKTRLHRADTGSSPYGWLSREYGSKQPGFVLVSEAGGALPMEWRTTLGVSREALSEDFQEQIETWKQHIRS